MTTSSNATYEQEFWVEFIELYKSMPVLWKYGSEVYKDRKGKKRAYEELVEWMRDVVPNATVDTVKRKINSFRSCYRRKWFKAQENIKLGIEPKEKWVYFDHFSFLRECKDSFEEEDKWSYCEDSSFVRLDDSEQADGESNSAVEYAPQKITQRTIRDSAASRTTMPRNGIRDVLYIQKNQPNDEDDVMKMALKITAQHKFWIDFIKMYESKPELWRYGSEVYKDRDAKKRAYMDLVEKLQEIEPNATVDLVKKKINSLRSMYRRKLNITKRAIRLGKEPENKWVYFDYFSFLHVKDPLQEEVEEEDWSQCEDSRYVNLEGNVDNTELNNVEESGPVVKLLSTENNKKFANDSPTTSPKRARVGSADISHKQLKQSNDEADILGISWAYQYRSLSETQKLFAKKAIDDILFEGRLETLQRNSVKINGSNCEKCKSL